MSDHVDYRPFARALPPGRARALPWMTVIAGSAITAWPVIATVPLMPPFGLLMLLSWRLLAPFALRRWAAAPLGLADDLFSGQPLGSAVLLWSACFIAIDLIEQRLAFRDFWQDWLIGGGAVTFCLLAGRFIAVPFDSSLNGALLLQIAASVLLLPATARVVAWIDRKRGHRA
ncbi:rod shape-determining protein MreD [Sphingomonas gellani]|uniref:Rod shape-determining protein MreD n=1 Tax=Sphingomonas gellani TaxID=1166340 RepID=A0A1H7ZBR1_9SPHN|nr:rod shape-determining protein MreD [Sphingomonas gellani]SEM55693.1 rod shape-determining protein MreD [Sphingomonas gellani]